MRHAAEPPVFQDRVPGLDRADARLPGVAPVDPAQWLIRDEAFVGQLAVRDRLIADRPDDVLALLPEARAAAGECLDAVLAFLAEDAGYRVDAAAVTRPDGVRLSIDRGCPLATAGRLAQADLCLMQAGQGGHVLTGAVLCFPAGWTLAEKIGRPLVPIHAPVAKYDDDLARRVQRLFDAIRPGQVLHRANALLYREPDLFALRREADPPRRCPPGEARYLRSERQTLRRLPESGAVVFAIHTVMVPLERLGEAERASLLARAC